MTALRAEKMEERLINGVAVDKLFATIDAIRKDPGIARTHFRISNKWLNGGHNRTTIKDFFAAKEDRNHKTTFELDADEPPLLLGEDKGVNPVEHLLNALAACVTTTIVYHAAARGIVIRGVESRLEGDIDLRGFLGLTEEIPVGYRQIRLFFKIDADISDEEKEKLIGMGKKYSAVFNTIFTDNTTVIAQLDRG